MAMVAPCIERAGDGGCKLGSGVRSNGYRRYSQRIAGVGRARHALEHPELYRRGSKLILVQTGGGDQRQHATPSAATVVPEQR